MQQGWLRLTAIIASLEIKTLFSVTMRILIKSQDLVESVGDGIVVASPRASFHSQYIS
jgi:hypothetical protein